MGTVNGMKTRLAEKLPLLVMVLFVIQPLMDVLSFWMAELQMSNLLTLALRMLVLALMVLIGFWLSRRKKVYIIAAVICVVIGVGHMAASWNHGYLNIVSDLSNYIRVLQLPLTTLCLITALREHEKCYGAMQKAIVINVLLILLVQILAIVTGTEPHTYADGAGLIGWFSNTNTQSAIVTMVAPAAVVRLYQKKGLKCLWLWIALIGSCGSMYFLGTRLAYLGIVAMCFGLGCSMLLIRIRDWKKACAFLLVGILFLGLYPLSPMTGHRAAHEKEMGDKQGWLDNALENPDKAPTTSPDIVTTLQPEETPGPTETPEPSDGPESTQRPVYYDEELVASLTEAQKAKIEELTPNYNHYVSDLVAIFGVERTIVMFDFTTDITAMTHNRTKKLLVAEALMEDAPLLSKVFGLELARFTIGKYIYDVENDFHGIYYLYGAVGLAALLVFLGYFLFLIVKYLIKNFRRYFTLDAAGWGIALVMGLAHSYFTAGVLRRPSASFYLAAVLAAVYYLLKIKKYPDELEV